jgi:hypothetical protein
MNLQKFCMALSLAAVFGLTACGDDDSSPTGAKSGGKSGGSSNGSQAGSCDFTMDDDEWEYSYTTGAEKSVASTTIISFGSGTKYTQKIISRTDDASAKATCNNLDMIQSALDDAGADMKCENGVLVTTVTVEEDYKDYGYADKEAFFKATMNTCKSINGEDLDDASSSSKGGKSSSSNGSDEDPMIDEEEYSCSTEGAKKTIDGIAAVCYQGYWIPEEYLGYFEDDDGTGDDDEDWDDDDWDFDMSEDMKEFAEIIDSEQYACDDEGDTKAVNGVASVCMDGVWTPEDMVSKYLNGSCTDGDTDNYKFKLPNGKFATLKMECDEGEWFLDDVVMP